MTSVPGGPLGLQADETTLVVGPPLIGWRVWRVCREAEGVALRSTYKYEVVWPAREPLRAVCLCPKTIAPHATPGQGNGQECGIYALRDEESTRRWDIFARAPRPPTVGAAVGRVKLWGRVLRYEQGFKAEYAYPAELYLVELDDGLEADEIAEGLAERYGLPVTSRAQSVWR